MTCNNVNAQVSGPYTVALSFAWFCENLDRQSSSVHAVTFGLLWISSFPVITLRSVARATSLKYQHDPKVLRDVGLCTVIQVHKEVGVQRCASQHERSFHRTKVFHCFPFDARLIRYKKFWYPLQRVTVPKTWRRATVSQFITAKLMPVLARSYPKWEVETINYPARNIVVFFVE